MLDVAFRSLFEMHRRNGCKCPAILAQQFDGGSRNGEPAGALIARLFAPDDDSALDKRGQFAAYCRARTDVQQKQLFQCEWFSLFFRIPDLDDDIEISDGFKEG